MSKKSCKCTEIFHQMKLFFYFGNFWKYSEILRINKLKYHFPIIIQIREISHVTQHSNLPPYCTERSVHAPTLFKLLLVAQLVELSDYRPTTKVIPFPYTTVSRKLLLIVRFLWFALICYCWWYSMPFPSSFFYLFVYNAFYENGKI